MSVEGGGGERVVKGEDLLYIPSLMEILELALPILGYIGGGINVLPTTRAE
jgi:hypothetical protein